MGRKTDNSNFIQFLKDEKFIEWKLFPTDELNTYWNDFLLQHPGERENIELAEKHFRQIKISSHKVSQEKKRETVQRLEQSLRAFNRKRNIRRFTYVAAACVTILILMVLYLQKGVDRSEQDFMASSDYIIGNELESENILFITGNKTTSYSSNIDIHLDGSQTAKIRGEDKETENITIERHTMNKLIVPYGKRSEIVLADGTRAWLNSGSTFEFPSVFTEERREVFLTGEMYIEVAPDSKKQFIVHASNYEIRVHGTKFNVSTYSGVPSHVVLVEGSVSLQSTNSQRVLLSPSEQAIYSGESGFFSTRKVDAQSFISWKDGYLTFEDTPITAVLSQIGRYYNFSFNWSDDISFQELTCTGKIILSDNLDNVMTALTLISATKYVKEDKSIYIYKE